MRLALVGGIFEEKKKERREPLLEVGRAREEGRALDLKFV
jgi:hypothetical protein